MSQNDNGDLIYAVNENYLPIGISDLGEAGMDAKLLVFDLIANGRDIDAVNHIMGAHLEKIGISRMNIAAVGAVYVLILQWVQILIDTQPDADNVRAQLAAAVEQWRREDEQ